MTEVASPILLKRSTIINFHSTEQQRVPELAKYQKHSRFAFSVLRMHFWEYIKQCFKDFSKSKDNINRKGKNIYI